MTVVGNNLRASAPEKGRPFSWPAPASVLHALCGRPVLFPYYHLVTDEAVPHVRHLYSGRRIAEFQAHLDYFLRHHTPIDLSGLLRHARDGTPPPKRAFLLTFDDGFREMHDIVAPILVERGVPAVFFLNTATLDNRNLAHHQKISVLLEHFHEAGPKLPVAEIRKMLQAGGADAPDLATALRAIRWRQTALVDALAAFCGVDFGDYLRTHRPYLTSEQVRAMLRQGLDVGAHSIDHPRYSELRFDEQISQTKESMDGLVEQFGLKYRAFAFPHSDSGVTTAFFRTLFGDATLEISFGTAGLLADAWPRHHQRFSMEKGQGTAREIVARQCARLLYRTATRKQVVQHG